MIQGECDSCRREKSDLVRLCRAYWPKRVRRRSVKWDLPLSNFSKTCETMLVCPSCREKVLEMNWREEK